MGPPTPEDLDLPTLAAVNEHLRTFVTPEKQEKMDRVLSLRTQHIRVVLEDIFQPHNASAVMRSCECFGVQNLHVIENKYAYTPNREVSMGSSKWISLHRHRKPNFDNTTECLQAIKAKGYRIVATALSENTIPLSELDVSTPFALCFGTEESGISPTLAQQADEFIQIPMFGFTQSFNISVSAAMCLYDLCTRIRKSVPDWQIPHANQQQILNFWLHRTVKNAHIIQKEFLKNTP